MMTEIALTFPHHKATEANNLASVTGIAGLICFASRTKYGRSPEPHPTRRFPKKIEPQRIFRKAAENAEKFFHPSGHRKQF